MVSPDVDFRVHCGISVALASSLFLVDIGMTEALLQMAEPATMRQRPMFDREKSVASPGLRTDAPYA